MDAALLLVAANESCPQPQTSEHLAAIEIMKLKHIIILQNKIDLIKESAALNHYESILRFVSILVYPLVLSRIPLPMALQSYQYLHNSNTILTLSTSLFASQFLSPLGIFLLILD